MLRGLCGSWIPWLRSGAAWHAATGPPQYSCSRAYAATAVLVQDMQYTGSNLTRPYKPEWVQTFIDDAYTLVKRHSEEKPTAQALWDLCQTTPGIHIPTKSRLKTALNTLRRREKIKTLIAVPGTKVTQRFGYCLPEHYSQTMDEKREANEERRDAAARNNTPPQIQDLFAARSVHAEKQKIGTKRADKMLRVAMRLSRRSASLLFPRHFEQVALLQREQAAILASCDATDASPGRTEPRRAPTTAQGHENRHAADLRAAAAVRLCNALLALHNEQVDLERSVHVLQSTVDMAHEHEARLAGGLTGNELGDYRLEVKMRLTKLRTKTRDLQLREERVKERIQQHGTWLQQLSALCAGNPESGADTSGLLQQILTDMASDANLDSGALQNVMAQLHMKDLAQAQQTAKQAHLSRSRHMRTATRAVTRAKEANLREYMQRQLEITQKTEDALVAEADARVAKLQAAPSADAYRSRALKSARRMAHAHYKTRFEDAAQDLLKKLGRDVDAKKAQRRNLARPPQIAARRVTTEARATGARVKRHLETAPQAYEARRTHAMKRWQRDAAVSGDAGPTDNAWNHRLKA